MGMLDDRSVLVSGVGPGLGRATAEAILREGGQVVLTDALGTRVAEICGDLDPGGARSLAVEVDITSPEACAALPGAIAGRFDRLDGIVNVAALDDAVSAVQDDRFLADWERSAAVNVEGTMRITRTVVPLLKRSASGSIVLISSTSFARPRRTRWNGAYGMSKAALGTASYYLAEELGPDGIRTNVVAPGWKWGPVVEAYFDGEAARQGVDRDVLVDRVCEELSLRRMATDDDVANTAVFFLSDMAKAITGQTIFVDGGHVFR